MEPTTLTDEQIELRRGRITGSRIAGVCGLSPWSTPLDVYLEMRGEGPPRTVNKNMKRGIFLEPGIRKWAADYTGLRIEKAKKPGTVIHPDFDWIAASPDGVAYDEGKPGQPVAAIEIKAPDPYSPRIHDWGDPLEQEDSIPSYVIPQCIWEAACLGVQETICTALIGGDIRIYRVEFRQKLFDVMVDKAASFLTLVKAGTPPPLDGSDSAARWLADQYPNHVGVTYLQADDQIMEHVEGLKKVTGQIKELEASKQLAQNMIKKWLGENPGLTSAHGKISWKTATRRSLQQKKLVEWMTANHPEELKKFYEEKSSRTFRVPRKW